MARQPSRHQAFANRIAPQPAAEFSWKRARGVDWPNEDAGWLITLSDLTLLLLSFLVLWYIAEPKQVAVAQTAAETPPLTQENSESVLPVEIAPVALNWREFRDEMESYIEKLGFGQDVRIESASGEIVVSLEDSVPFSSGKADLRREVFPVLEKLAAMVIGQAEMRLEVHGHSDDRPIATTEFPTNWELSAARASRVARYLVEKGVHPSRIAVQGFADHRPRVPNTTTRNREENRRVEIRLSRNINDDGAVN